jgi:hypothetical protein
MAEVSEAQELPSPFPTDTVTFLLSDIEGSTSSGRFGLEDRVAVIDERVKGRRWKPRPTRWRGRCRSTTQFLPRP